ncbi:MAG: 2,3-oxidosqualene cyclase [Candidatus Rokuibacteriota bacterium]
MLAAAAAARDSALARLVTLQSPRGDWEGEVVWCPMITAQVVIVRHVVGRPVGAATRAGIVRYLRGVRTADGAWGLHPESAGYVFVTTLVYVALRLLGLERDEPLVADARGWLRGQAGGVLAIPTWGKLWLALLGLYGWAGVTPVLPELYALPRLLPFHPARWYCHTRYIYLAVAYVYGRRVTADLGPLGAALREELYAEPYATLDFAAHRHDVAASDLYVRPGPGLRVAASVLSGVDRVTPVRLRRRALDACLDRIRYEQRESRWLGLSPVNAVLDCLSLWAHDPADPALAASLDGLEGWRWEDAGGIRYAGARSNAWDTAFALRALTTGDEPAHAAAVRRGYGFLRDTQLTSELPRWREQDREPTAGGWCFSDGVHRWPVSDCTAEAVSALLSAEPVIPQSERTPATRLALAARFILARQNRDGGFGTYEPRRGGPWLERLNASEMFGRCMTERSYIECTASCVSALARLGRRDPTLVPGVAPAIERGVRFLRASQRVDGAITGAWGINFTYGAFHFVAGLRGAGVAADDLALVRAAEWLVARQRPDGGWGEHWSGCLHDRYVEHALSQPVQTAWALLALLDVVGATHASVERGIDWLCARQEANGGWPAGSVNGVFFGTAMLDYRLYSAYFPAWALARYARQAGPDRATARAA